MSKQLSMLALFVAALSVSYYFGYYLPHVHDAELAGQRRKTDVELAQRCRDDGLKLFNDFVSETNDASERLIWDDPQFHYSTKLNTCLVAIRYVDMGAFGSNWSFQYNKVVDVYENRPILLGEFERTVGENDKPTTEKLLDSGESGVPNYTSTEFFAKKQKLFSE